MQQAADVRPIGTRLRGELGGGEPVRGPIDGASARWVTIELLSLLCVAPGSRATRLQRGKAGVASSGRAADRRTRLRGGLGGREAVRGPIDGASAR